MISVPIPEERYSVVTVAGRSRETRVTDDSVMAVTFSRSRNELGSGACQPVARRVVTSEPIASTPSGCQLTTSMSGRYLVPLDGSTTDARVGSGLARWVGRTLKFAD